VGSDIKVMKKLVNFDTL